MKCDLLVRGGTVIDPSQDLHAVRDVAVSAGRIAALGENLKEIDAKQTIDARGLLVVPGLIDLHVHIYRHSPWGLDPDAIGPAGGVTTMLDTGTAGPYNFAAFRRETIDRARARCLALVHLSATGLVMYQLGELLDRRHADPEGVVRVIAENPGVAIGVKIRASRNLMGEGEQARASFLDGVRAARRSKTWLMIHIGNTAMTLPEMLEHLSPGDCITHCFKGHGDGVTDAAGKLFPEVRAAAERGIVFDVGHGAGSFNWDAAEAAFGQGFHPTTISTDLHTLCVNGPVYDMPATMSKFLILGMPIEEIVARTTAAPAKVLGLEKEIGTLKTGAIADIALLERLEGRFVFTDAYRKTRIGKELLRAALTIQSGEVLQGGGSLAGRHLAET